MIDYYIFNYIKSDKSTGLLEAISGCDKNPSLMIGQN